ncbi:MAG TPA: hypothetical protein VFM70_05690, partial [Salinimicrobium sp.]|nr:hypothetical protein [Salinimicrobium sp.]
MARIKINEELIDRIKSGFDLGELFTSIRLGEEEIVSLSHRHDGVCHYVQSPIRNFYYSPLKDLGLKNNNSHLNDFPPYIHLSNDLHIRIDRILYILEMIMKMRNQPNPQLESNEYQYVEDLIPIFEGYVNSFRTGFNSFMEIFVTPHLLVPNDRVEIAEKIFDFIKSSWHPVRYKNGYNDILSAGIYMGLTEGYNYRAWSFILYNERLFLPLFKENEEHPSYEAKFELDIHQVKAKHYAMSYFLDSIASGDVEDLKQEDLEKLLFNR